MTINLIKEIRLGQKQTKIRTNRNQNNKKSDNNHFRKMKNCRFIGTNFEGYPNFFPVCGCVICCFNSLHKDNYENKVVKPVSILIIVLLFYLCLCFCFHIILLFNCMTKYHLLCDERSA